MGADVRLARTAIEISHKHYGRKLLDQGPILGLQIWELGFRATVFGRAREKMMDRPCRLECLKVTGISAGQFLQDGFRLRGAGVLTARKRIWGDISVHLPVDAHGRKPLPAVANSADLRRPV